MSYTLTEEMLCSILNIGEESNSSITLLQVSHVDWCCVLFCSPLLLVNNASFGGSLSPFLMCHCSGMSHQNNLHKARFGDLHQNNLHQARFGDLFVFIR